MKKLLTFLILVLIIGAVLFFGKAIFKDLASPKTELPVLVEEFKKRIATPPPLIVEVRLPESFLTQAGVVEWTNIQREKQKLHPLKENQRLNKAALLKIEDMLAKQYFGHISPNGQGVGDLADDVNYEFIAIGENLALGDFENDEKLVQGWMQSPGHRENILSSHYQEIGVAVLKGEFQGRTTWLAVQHFGRPLSSCPQPSDALLVEISQKQDKIEELYYILSKLQEEISAMRPKRGPVYNQKVDEYNNLVLQYNAVIVETKGLIELYNSQVQSFNRCAAGV